MCFSQLSILLLFFGFGLFEYRISVIILTLFNCNNNFMWNYIASNRILDKKRKQEAQRKHLQALNNIKSQINNTRPS